MTKTLRDNKKLFTVFVQNLPRFTLRQKGRNSLSLYKGAQCSVCGDGDLLIGSLLTALLVWL